MGDDVHNFMFIAPTPGEANKISGAASLIENVYPMNAPLSATIGGAEIILLTLAAAATIASLTLYATIKNEYLNDIFFGKY